MQHQDESSGGTNMKPASNAYSTVSRRADFPHSNFQTGFIILVMHKLKRRRRPNMNRPGTDYSFTRVLLLKASALRDEALKYKTAQAVYRIRPPMGV